MEREKRKKLVDSAGLEEKINILHEKAEKKLLDSISDKQNESGNYFNRSFY